MDQPESWLSKGEVDPVGQNEASLEMISFHACLLKPSNKDWTPFPSPPCAIPLSLSEVPQRGTETRWVGAGCTHTGRVGCAAKQQQVQTPFCSALLGKGWRRACMAACLLQVVVLILHTSSAHMGGLALAAAPKL